MRSVTTPFPTWPWPLGQFRPRDHKIVKRSWVTLAIVCAQGAFAKHGDVLSIMGNSQVPDGWVIIDVSAPAMRSIGPASALPPSAFTLTIKDVKDAPVGTVERVKGNSMIPNGWVIIQTVWPATRSTGRSASLPDHSAVHTIKRIA